MRSCAGTTTSAGWRTARRRAPAGRRRATAPRAGRSAPYQPPRHSRATGSASGTPSLSQSSTATKWRAAGLSGGRAAKRANLRSADQRIDRGEQRLQHVDRHLAERGEGRAPAARQARPSSRAWPGALGMEAPGRRQQRQRARPGADAARPAPAPAARPCNSRGRRCGRPARRLAPRRPPPRAGRRCTRSRPKPRSSGPGPPQSTSSGRSPARGEMAQQARLGREIEDIGAVDQRGHDQHRRRRRRAP